MKLLLKIILKRNQVFILNENSGETQFGLTQFGFKSGSGTRDAICTYAYHYREVFGKRKRSVYMYASLIMPRHSIGSSIRKPLSVSATPGWTVKDLRVITNLYWNQRACIRNDNEVSDFAEIKRGVRQGCILSPSLFNLYIECIFQSIEGMRGINISGNIVNNLRYADDTVLIADNEQDLQNIVDTIHRQSKEFGLDMNVKKTKTMVISRIKA